MCLHAHLSPNLHPSGALNFVTFGTMSTITCISFWQLPFLKFVQGNLFAFLDGLLPVSFACVSSTTVIATFSMHLSNFGAGDSDGEGERDRPFPLSFLCGSCLNDACFSK